MEINYTSIGKMIRRYRKSMGVTQAELAEISGIEPSNISHIERGATKVSLPTLVKIANALNVSLDDLVYESINNNRHISVKMFEEELIDCSASELMALVEIVKTVKSALRRISDG